MHTILHRVRSLAWLIPALGVLAFAIIVTIHFFFLVGGSHPFLADSRVALADGAKRLFVSSSIALSLAELGGITYSIFIISRASLSRTELSGLGVFLGIWLAFVVWIDFGPNLGGEYADAVLSNITDHEGPIVLKVADIASKAGGLSIAFVVMAVCALCHRSAGDGPRAISIRVRDFQQLLYLTAGLLLTGMLFTFSLFRWAALLATSPEAGMAARIFGDGIVLGAGVFYTVLLVIAFVPVAAIQGRMIDDLEKNTLESDPSIDLVQWRSVNQLDFSPLAAMRTYVVMASPFLTGAFGFLAKGIF